jgi:hypothetical protein
MQLAAAMRTHLRNIPLVLMVLATSVQADPSSTLLDRLAQELKSMRSHPVGTPTHSVCPKNISALMGLPQERVHVALDAPDFIDSDQSWSYFFTSPVPPGQRGGGFPQITFTFDGKGLVSHVTCYYAR